MERYANSTYYGVFKVLYCRNIRNINKIVLDRSKEEQIVYKKNEIVEFDLLGTIFNTPLAKRGENISAAC
jgi:hypothetical protein